MAEFVLAPSERGENSTALLFFCSQVLTGETEEQADLQQKRESSGEESDLKRKFDSITQKLSQIPVFVLDRSQTFEHKQTRTGHGLHSHVSPQMLQELDILLPPELRVTVKTHAQSVLQRKYVPGSVSTKPLEQSSSPSTSTEQDCVQYMRCKKVSGESSEQHLEACFIHLPSWDTLDVHYFSLSVRPKPKSKLKFFFSQDETLDVVGMRSIKRFSMVCSTANKVVSQQDKNTLERKILQFYSKTNHGQNRSLPTPTDGATPLRESSKDDVGSRQQVLTERSNSGTGGSEMEGNSPEDGNLRSQVFTQDGTQRQEPPGIGESSVDPERSNLLRK